MSQSCTDAGSHADVLGRNEALLGAVGTLVVCLPSPHQGGDVHVKLASAEEKLTSSGQRPSFMCWYALTFCLNVPLR